MEKNKLFDEIVCITIDDAKKKSMSNKLAEWFGGEYPIHFMDGVRVDKDTKSMTVDETYRHPTLGRKITYGEIGCALAHINAWKRSVEHKKISLIIEDDIITSADNVTSYIDRLACDGLVGRHWDMLYLGRHPIFPDIEESINDDWVIPSTSWCAHSYIIRPSGAAKLLDPDYTNKVFVVDDYIPCRFGEGFDQLQKKWSHKPQLEVFALRDNLFYQEDQGPARAIKSKTENSEMYINPKKDATSRKHGIITIATDDDNRGYKFLSDCCTNLGWKYNLNIAGAKDWDGGDMSAQTGGGARKIYDLKYALDNVYKDPEDILIFVDGYDVIPFATPYEVIQNWLDHFDEEKILFSAERFVWPAMQPADVFSEPGTYEYLNSGSFIGKAGKIKDLVDSIFDKFIDLQPSDDDQKIYHMMGSSGSRGIILDTESVIFQTFDPDNIIFTAPSGSIRMMNRNTKTFPAFLHCNGGREAKKYHDTVISYINDVTSGMWVGDKDFAIYCSSLKT